MRDLRAGESLTAAADDMMVDSFVDVDDVRWIFGCFVGGGEEERLGGTESGVFWRGHSGGIIKRRWSVCAFFVRGKLYC